MVIRIVLFVEVCKFLVFVEVNLFGKIKRCNFLIFSNCRFNKLWNWGLLSWFLYFLMIVLIDCELIVLIILFCKLLIIVCNFWLYIGLLFMILWFNVNVWILLRYSCLGVWILEMVMVRFEFVCFNLVKLCFCCL